MRNCVLQVQCAKMQAQLNQNVSRKQYGLELDALKSSFKQSSNKLVELQIQRIQTIFFHFQQLIEYN